MTDRAWWRSQGAEEPFAEGAGETPELGFEPRSEAPQASRMSKLPHSGAAVASRRRYNSYRSRGGTDSLSTSIARWKISSIRPLEIGRASCRESVEIPVVVGSC